MRLEMIRNYLAGYQEARRILASNFISMPERKAAIDIRDEFKTMAPALVKELLEGITELINDAEHEECADPDSCGSADYAWRCSRCRLRTCETR